MVNVCMICVPNKCFNHKYSLVRHTKEVHQKSHNYKCPRCSMGFKRRERLNVHLRIHSQDDRNIEVEVHGKNLATTTINDLCNTKENVPNEGSISTSTTVQGMRLNITGSNNKQNEILSSEGLTRKRKLDQQDDDECLLTFKCNHCKTYFNEKRCLDQHKINCNSTAGSSRLKYSCSKCTKRFGTDQSLREHQMYCMVTSHLSVENDDDQISNEEDDSDDNYTVDGNDNDEEDDDDLQMKSSTTITRSELRSTSHNTTNTKIVEPMRGLGQNKRPKVLYLPTSLLPTPMALQNKRPMIPQQHIPPTTHFTTHPTSRPMPMANCMPYSYVPTRDDVIASIREAKNACNHQQNMMPPHVVPALPPPHRQVDVVNPLNAHMSNTQRAVTHAQRPIPRNDKVTNNVDANMSNYVIVMNDDNPPVLSREWMLQRC